MPKCKICELERRSLYKHIHQVHNITTEEYMDKFKCDKIDLTDNNKLFSKGYRPVKNNDNDKLICKECGNKFMSLSHHIKKHKMDKESYEKKYGKTIFISPKLSEHISKRTSEEMSDPEVLKKMVKNRTDKSGYIAWNKGLTKETSEKVKKYNEKQVKTWANKSEKEKEKYARNMSTGTHKKLSKKERSERSQRALITTKNKYLTKENYERVKETILKEKPMNFSQLYHYFCDKNRGTKTRMMVKWAVNEIKNSKERDCIRIINSWPEPQAFVYWEKILRKEKITPWLNENFKMCEIEPEFTIFWNRIKHEKMSSSWGNADYVLLYEKNPIITVEVKKYSGYLDNAFYQCEYYAREINSLYFLVTNWRISRWYKTGIEFGTSQLLLETNKKEMKIPQEILEILSEKEKK